MYKQMHLHSFLVILPQGIGLSTSLLSLILSGFIRRRASLASRKRQPSTPGLGWLAGVCRLDKNTTQAAGLHTWLVGTRTSQSHHQPVAYIHVLSVVWPCWRGKRKRCCICCYSVDCCVKKLWGKTELHRQKGGVLRQVSWFINGQMDTIKITI